MGHDRDVAEFVARHAPIERPAFDMIGDGFRAFGVLREDGALVAGVVFSDWKPAFGTVELSGAAVDPRALASTRNLRVFGSYAFGQLDCFRVWARTATANVRARKWLRGIGFTEEGVSAHHFGKGKHAAILRVIRPEWERKWGAIESARKAA